MAKRLTDKEKKEIIQYYIECQNYRETGRKFGVSNKTVERLIKSQDNKKMSQEITQKRQENTKTVLQAMEERKQSKINLLDKILKAMDEKLDNIDMFTNIKDLATAYGIIMDKEIKLKEIDSKNKDSQDVLDRLDRLLEEQKNA